MLVLQPAFARLRAPGRGRSPRAGCISAILLAAFAPAASPTLASAAPEVSIVEGERTLGGVELQVHVRRTAASDLLFGGQVTLTGGRAESCFGLFVTCQVDGSGTVPLYTGGARVGEDHWVTIRAGALPGAEAIDARVAVEWRTGPTIEGPRETAAAQSRVATLSRLRVQEVRVTFADVVAEMKAFAGTRYTKLKADFEENEKNLETSRRDLSETRDHLKAVYARSREMEGRLDRLRLKWCKEVLTPAEAAQLDEAIDRLSRDLRRQVGTADATEELLSTTSRLVLRRLERRARWSATCWRRRPSSTGSATPSSRSS